jgi:hypothetical protein
VAGQIAPLASTFSNLYIEPSHQPGSAERYAMSGQEPDTVSFVGMNLILIGVVGLLIFAYFVLLIRKRWKQGFLHQVDEKKENKEKRTD